MKRIISLILVLVLCGGVLAGARALGPITAGDNAEPWLGFTGEHDPAGVASGRVDIQYMDEEPLPETQEIGGSLGIPGGMADHSGGYLNDGGRYNVEAMVSFMDDDCRLSTYETLYRQVIEPLGLPYTLSLPLDKLNLDGYIDETQLSEMLENGVSISCHAFSEDAMTGYDVWELDEMLRLWQETAETLDLGEVLSYSYCNGIWSDELITAVKAHFRMGFTVDAGINQMPYESFFMKRVGLFSNKTQSISLTTRDGTYLNANGTLIRSTPGQRRTSGAIAVKEGEEYLVTCSAIWGGAAYAVYNSAGKVLEKYNVADTAKGELLMDYKVFIPEGASYMVLSHNTQNYPATEMAADKVPDSASLTNAKRYVDQVAEEGGWLVFMTHAWYSGFSADELRELVAYIQEAGIPIVDVNDAIRLTGNVIEVGTFRKPLEYADGPYFVVSADGRVYTNSLDIPDVPENYESIRLSLIQERMLYNDRSIYVNDPAYVVSRAEDISGCEAVLISGWAYAYEKGYQHYIITDENGKVLARRNSTLSYAEGGEYLDHVYIELPEGAAFITIAGNTYYGRPELTKIYRTDQ